MRDVNEFLQVLEDHPVSYVRSWGASFRRHHDNPNSAGITVSGMHAQLSQVQRDDWRPAREREIARRVQELLIEVETG